MITIFEDNSKKISGNTSLFLDFPYSKDIVNIIKSSETYSFDKATKLWEVPITSLSYLLDNLTYFDDIKLIVINNVKSLENQREIILEHKTKPFDYQLEGIKYGLNHDKWLLLDGCGLGKSLEGIYIAEELHAQDNLEHCLIVCCQNSLKTNWKKEIEKHSNLNCRILGENISKSGRITYATVKDRLDELKNKKIEEFFIITNVETLRDEKAADAINKSINNINMIFIDEAHRIKSSKSLASDTILKLNKAKYRIAATGTLLLNSPLDAYVPLKWIGKENHNLTQFKLSYCVFNVEQRGRIIGYKNMDILKDIIESCSLRRTKEEVLKDLPPKTIIPEFVDMNENHRKFYNGIVHNIKEELEKVDLVTLKRKNLLSMVTRLRQATACPAMLSSDTSIESSKINRAINLVEDITSDGSKVVIMSNFKETTLKLKEELKDYKPIICTGDESEKEVSENVDKFQEDPSRKVFIATWQKMGTGFTLNAASYMINLDTAWTWGLFEQTCDRIYRIGTKKPVFIYNLICKDTIDEKVWKILNTKKAISEYIVDNNENQEVIDELTNYILDL